MMGYRCECDILPLLKRRIMYNKGYRASQPVLTRPACRGGCLRQWLGVAKFSNVRGEMIVAACHPTNR